MKSPLFKMCLGKNLRKSKALVYHPALIHFKALRQKAHRTLS